MIILDVGIGYDLCGLDCRKKKKILQVHGDVFLMLWTIWGFGRDISCTCTLVSMKPPEMNLQ